MQAAARAAASVSPRSTGTPPGTGCVECRVGCILKFYFTLAKLGLAVYKINRLSTEQIVRRQIKDCLPDALPPAPRAFVSMRAKEGVLQV